MSKITWLHLSDFHFRTEKSPSTSKVEDFNRGVVLDSLLEDVRKYPAEHALKVDFVIITGDVAYSGQEHEYREAEKFLDKLRGVLKLEKDRLFVVPGNHDVDRSKIKRALKLDLDSKDGINEFLMDGELKSLAFKKFQGYRDFVDRYFEKRLTFDYEDNYFWTRSFLIGETKIAMLGLNSAWNSCGDKDERQLLIGEKQVADALKQTEKPKPDLRIAAFHHPCDWLRSDEGAAVEGDLGRNKCPFVLHGHLHKAGYSLTVTPDYQVATIPAGSCYDKRPYRNSYNYVTFDPVARTGELHLRAYVDGRKGWEADNATFMNAKAGVCDIDFNIRTSEERDKTRKPGKSVVSTEIPANYKDWVNTQCGMMDISNLVESRDSELISLKLPEIFIPLYTDVLTKNRKSRKKRLDAEMEREPVDIEKLAASNEYLVVRGQAGSGKTTLMKHLAYSIIQKKNGHGLDDYLPILIFLGDLPGVITQEKPLVSGMQAAEEMLSAYFQKKCGGLDVELIKAYRDGGKAIFLVDGLDEVDPALREVFVDSMAIFRGPHTQSKFVLSGRPHGVDNAVNCKFPNRCVDINSLNREQVELFVNKWFKWDTELRAKGKNPEDMLGEIYEHERGEELMSTPLMLTAACIVYHYDKKLPEQRADLYERFIKNLIYKRFPNNAVAVLDLLMKIAHETHGERKKAFGGSRAVEIMSPENPKRPEETDRQHIRRLHEEFEKIERRCGLIKLEGAEYSFWHLSFQEFLAGREIAERKRAQEFATAIKEYWEDDWFSETLRLFIGHLSNGTGRADANGIVSDELGKADRTPFRHWRLASKALLDIQPDRRDKSVVDEARSRLLSIIEGKEDGKVLADAGDTLGWLGDTRDLKEFVKIEGGEYKLKELGKGSLSAFEISRYLVTNQWYEEFIKAGGYKKKSEQLWTPKGWKWLKDEKHEEPRLWHDRAWKCPNAPVVGVSWYEADAFCRWLTMTSNDGHVYRLPTEQEWQAVAVGKEGREYPWGSKWQKNHCNTDESGIGKTSAVGIFAMGKTPEGVADLAGNVDEWTCSDYDIKKQRADFEADKRGPVIRGGSWSYDREVARCSDRSRFFPYLRSDDVGFRCVGIK